MIWQKALVQEGYDPASIRKDACGAWIVYSEYGNKDSDFGWEIDHIVPRSILESQNVSDDKINDMENLRPLNWRNNESKGDDYPDYTSSVTSQDDTNVLINQTYTVNKNKQQTLKRIFEEYDF